MSTDRARALQYAAQVQKNRNSRKQPDNFGRPRTGPPSYAFQDNQRGSVDDKSDETREIRVEEKKQSGDEDKDIIDSSDFSKGTETGKAPTPTATSSSQPAVETDLKSAFSKCWTTVDTINVPELFYDEKSFFHPILIAIMEVLFDMELILNGNEELRWISPNYFSLPVRVYYAVIAIVQVYRAKEQAGMLSKSEGSWLRAFNRRFKDTQCPIAGPLVPILTNIVSSLPDDSQFDYIYPTLETTGTYSTEYSEPKSVPNVSSSHYLIPSVTILADMLKRFCVANDVGDNRFDAFGNYVPFRLSDGGDIGGIRFPPQTQANPLPANFVKLLLNPGIMRPLPEGRDRLREIHSFYKRSRAKNFPAPRVEDGFTPSGPSDFTGIGEIQDWFQTCIDMANVNAKFWSDSTNLSAIPTVGGQSSTVQVQFRLPSARTIPTAITDWYPDLFSTVKAKFRSTSAQLPQDHIYAAAYALTNGKIPWTDSNGHSIGSRASGLRGGPYWDNRKFNFQLDSSVPVLSGTYTMLQTQFYDAHSIH